MVSIENLIYQFPDPPQRIAGRNPLLNRYEREQGAAAHTVASHLGWATEAITQRWSGFSANS